MPCSNCHSAGRSLRTKLPVLGDLSTRGAAIRREILQVLKKERGNLEKSALLTAASRVPIWRAGFDAIWPTDDELSALFCNTIGSWRIIHKFS